MSTIEHGLNVCSRHNFDNSKSKQNNSEKFGVLGRAARWYTYLHTQNQNLDTFWRAFGMENVVCFGPFGKFYVSFDKFYGPLIYILL
jgi:hypothetical protein